MDFVKSEGDSINISGKKAYMIKEKFKLLREIIRWWNREVYGWLDLIVENVVTKINYMDDYFLNGNNVAIEEDKLEWMKAQKYVWKVMNQKDSLLKQNVRLSWLKYGDKNSIFFPYNNERVRIDIIISLPTSQGRVDSVVDVKEVLRKFSEARFTEPDRYRPNLDILEFDKLDEGGRQALEEKFSK